MKLKLGKIRGITRVAIILSILAAVYFGLTMAGLCYIKIGYLRLICPVGFMEISLSSHKIYWNLVAPLILTVSLIIILGRFFCSWACPAEILTSQFKKFGQNFIPKKTNKKLKNWWKSLKQKGPKLGLFDGLALFTGACIGVAIFSYPFISTICPIGVVSRNLISLIRHFSLRWELVFLVIPIVLAPLFLKGWKCCCPVGSVNGLLSGLNKTFIPQVNQDLCNGCGLCERICPLDLSPQKGEIDTKLCQKCLDCIDACPKKAISLVLVPHKTIQKPKAQKADQMHKDQKAKAA